MKKLNQRGFSAPHLLLVLLVVAIIGGVGYYVFQANKDINKNLDTTNSSQNELKSTKKEADASEPKAPATVAAEEDAASDKAQIKSVTETYCIAKDTPCTPTVKKIEGDYAEASGGKYNLLLIKKSDNSWVLSLAAMDQDLCDVGSDHSGLEEWCN